MGKRKGGRMKKEGAYIAAADAYVSDADDYFVWRSDGWERGILYSNVAWAIEEAGRILKGFKRHD